MENKNALKHGRYTADAIARRREISDLIRGMKMLAPTGMVCGYQPLTVCGHADHDETAPVSRRLAGRQS